MRAITAFCLLILIKNFWRSCSQDLDDIPVKLYLDETFQTNDQACNSLTKVIVSFSGETVTLKLSKVTNEFVSEDAFLKDGDGKSNKLISYKTCVSIGQLEHKDFNLAVNLVVDNGNINGQVYLNDDAFDIVPTSIEVLKKQNNRLYLEYPDSSSSSSSGGISVETSTDDSDKHFLPSDDKEPNLDSKSRNKRSAPIFHHSPPIQQKFYMELFLVFDNEMYNQLGSVPVTKTFALEVVNLVNANFRSLSMHVVLVGLEIWSTKQNIEMTDEFIDYLREFSLYRRVNIKVKHDVAYLITNQLFNGNASHIHYRYGMCLYQHSVGIGTTYYSSSAIQTANTMTKGLASILGINKDNENCTCSDSKLCLMNAEDNPYLLPPWSNCSRDEYEDLKRTFLIYCLKDKPHFAKTESPHPYPICGNGIVDQGEDCDTGPTDVTSPCCNSTTCKFQGEAECASGACCNTATCKRKPRGAPCSVLENICDFQEYCDGVKETCPDDTYAADGTKTCGFYERDYCYKKQCGSSEEVCHFIYGSMATPASDIFPQQNAKDWGDSQATFGYCSYSIIHNTAQRVIYMYNLCASQDYLCGRIHCTNYLSKSTWLPTNKLILRDFGIYTSVEKSKGTLLDTSLSEMKDPAMVRDGAYCGSCKVCKNTKCVPISQIRTVSCSCQNGGQCNNFGSCHCPKGFRGSTCAIPCEECCGGSEHANYCISETPVTPEYKNTSRLSCTCPAHHTHGWLDGLFICTENCIASSCHPEGGICKENFAEKIRCECNFGFSGDRCDNDQRGGIYGGIAAGCVAVVAIVVVIIVLKMKGIILSGGK